MRCSTYLSIICLICSTAPLCGQSGYDAAAETAKQIAKLNVAASDWPQAGGSPLRNSVTKTAVPTSWDVASGENIRWVRPLGSTTYGNPVVANGQVYVGTNNSGAFVKRYPKDVDLGVLLCVEEKNGKFLWQHSSEKLAAGSHVDWPDQGICSTPLVVGNRVYFVNNRGEVLCLDAAGFHDGKNDGAKSEANENKDEADVVWSFDMMAKLKVHQHYMANCSVTTAGDFIFVVTSQGIDEDNNTADVPSFICLNRNSGELVWSDNSPSLNVLHGQWSSPAYAELGGVGQAIFGGGDGWIYSFEAAGANGKSKLLWKFDCNPKASKFVSGGGGDRNYIVATPSIYDGKVYIAVGDDPEFGSANGRLWCIDPTKRGDVSPTIVVDKANKPVPAKRIQALEEKNGETEKPNPNSAAVWVYVGSDSKVFEKTMHRGIGSATIANNLLFIADFGGIIHCVDAQTGKAHWTHDMFSACWAAPLVAGEHVYVSDEEGDIAIFKLSDELELVEEINMMSSVLTTPTVANSTLYISTRNQLFAIQEGAKSIPSDSK
jgi:outer membrane protein assembly factor BamB